MFTAVLNFFAGLWDIAKGIFQGIWNYIRGGYVWLVGIVLAIITALVSFVHWITDIVGIVTDKVASIVMPSTNASQSVGDMLSVINYFFPLQEMFVIIIAVCTLWMAMLFLRFIKWLREMIIA